MEKNQANKINIGIVGAIIAITGISGSLLYAVSTRIPAEPDEAHTVELPEDTTILEETPAVAPRYQYIVIQQQPFKRIVRVRIE